MDILIDFIRESNDRREKVLHFQQPSELQKLFDFNIPEKPQNLATLLEDCRSTLKHQVKTGNYNEN